MAKRVRISRQHSLSVEGKVIGNKVKRSDVSRQTALSEGLGGIIKGSVVPTPYDMPFLQKTRESSNIIGACIDSMAVNISGYGFKIEQVDRGVPKDPDEEKVLKSFIERANVDQTLRSICTLRTIDKEGYGFSFLEVIRDGRNRVSLLRHAKSFYVRLLSYGDTSVKVTSEVQRGGRRSRITEFKKFRKYVQDRGVGKVTYFKEFGDKRRMSYITGRYESDTYKVPKDELATEILHEKLPSEESYGVPRWISHLPSMIGSREAEETNMAFFENNTVPPMMLLVGGGRLTKSSFQSLTKMLNGQGVGKDRQNQIMLIEAIPETTGLDDKGTLSIKVEKLTDARPSDGLFKEYDDSNRVKIRGSFRIPAILLGENENQNFASATASIAVAESQVFVPARRTQDEFLNLNLINSENGLNLRTVKLVSESPVITSPDQVIKVATAANAMGAITPRTAIDAVNDTMQISIPQYPAMGESGYEEWMDIPMALGMKIVAQTDTQQTGDTMTTHDAQSLKGQKNKSIEANGEVGIDSNNVENGSEGDLLTGME